jgi:tRNA 5-methylaminomethyl-2-thiouridine biosynthesis bifunctional protein
MTAKVIPARLKWCAGYPYSLDFADIYFSDDGIAESRTVFLAHNHLPQRWQTFPHHIFRLVELGFGSGLNFLVTCQAFAQHAPAHLHLAYYAVEKYPLEVSDLEKVYANWPALHSVATPLLKVYPALQAGIYKIEFERISLQLHFADVRDFLPVLPAQIHAWYLDGFAPAKNPAMWNDFLFQNMAAHSAPDATLATFTAAGFVRRGLQAAGFAIEKVPGFGRKREMLRGKMGS